MGLNERGGRMVTEIIPDVSTASLREVTLRRVEKGFAVSTDEWSCYALLKRDGIRPQSVNHNSKQWRKCNYRRDEWHYVNNVESFWRVFKNSIR
jgi:ISXO2 transposase-like protein